MSLCRVPTAATLTIKGLNKLFQDEYRSCRHKNKIKNLALVDLPGVKETCVRELLRDGLGKYGEMLFKLKLAKMNLGTN